MLTWKKIVTAVLVLALAGAIYGWFLYHKPPLDIREQEASIKITAVDLLQAFQMDEMVANAKYVDKILMVTGTVCNIQPDSNGATVYLQTSDLLAAITCSFYKDDKKVKKLKAGSPARIKGVCTGMLTDVVLNKCSLVE